MNNLDPFDPNEWCKKIIREVNETDEAFIFSTIKPFIDSITTMEISKKELTEAVMLIRMQKEGFTKYCNTPFLPSDMKCNCLKETQIESYFNTIDRNMRDDTKPCSFCESFEKQHDGNHIYKDEKGQFYIMADTGDSFQWGAIEDVHYCPYCGRRLENDNKLP